MIYTCERRLVDGLLTWPQAAPEQTHDDGRAVRLAEAAALFGGTTAEYEFVTLTEAQYHAVMNAIPARSFLVAGALSRATAPSLSSDKAAIANDGVEIATITAVVGDPTYTGAITWTVSNPNDGTIAQTESMVAGAATLELATTLIGSHLIQAETQAHGVGSITVEGV